MSWYRGCYRVCGGGYGDVLEGRVVIMHNCIECDYFEMIPIAKGQLPKIQKYTCPECKTLQWIKHSRIDPETYSADMIEVDEVNKVVKIKESK